MDEETVFLTMDEKAEKAVEHTANEFAAVNTGKANPGMVEGIQVEAYGSQMALKEMAAITTPDARTIAVQPWDKSTLKAIEKAILASNIGITPAIMGDVIRLPLPELTGDRRQELVKLVSKQAEDGRVAVRNARRDAMDALKKLQKAGEITEDELKTDEKEIQETTDNSIKKINDLLAAKEKELTTV
ncbi:ribosome recycling factor [Pelagicoccus sp. NFK12]|uniref:Ribosome-recycling factor n=1 Tax=Pelagicoccus enzymogenes TaxID=2773457 RepID=A0A927F5M0_9BACT|nr:ribosome recycling factor [Pelagicoccus enzymogenes]MBD5778465.1 ribosome recycling factor [Pelagicoccus enzymogenes]MDQ8197174.1 ribosome recycling factor [Pelagicoccus enzymogenes]